MTRILATLLFLTSTAAQAGNLNISWTRTTHDIGGYEISTDNIEYLIYHSIDEGEFRLAATTPDAMYIIEDQPAGCHTIYLKSRRLDSGIESVKSNSVQACIGVHGPLPPSSVTVTIAVEPTENRVTVDGVQVDD